MTVKQVQNGNDQLRTVKRRQTTVIMAQYIVKGNANKYQGKGIYNIVQTENVTQKT